MDLKINFNLSYIRKYSAMLVPIGIGVLSVIIYVFVVLGNRSLAKQMNDNSIAVGNRISGMGSDTPSSEQYAEEKKRQDKIEEEVSQVLNYAKQSSQFLLLSDHKLFPEPVDKSHQVFIQFGTALRKQLEEEIERLNALDAPTEGEISQQLGVKISSTPTSSYMGGVRQVDTSAMQIDAFCTKRAEEISIYANPKSFAWYDFWEKYSYPGSEKAIKDAWHSQISFIVYKDVIETVANLNAGSTSVFTSKVKRIIGVSFQRPAEYRKSGRSYMGYGGGDYGESSRGDNPTYIQLGYPSPLNTDHWTNRICDDKIDVIHFSVGVIVDKNCVSEFMKELCSERTHKYYKDFEQYDKQGKTLDENESPPLPGRHNNITILQSNYEAVDMAGEDAHKYYRYGPGSVVRLDMICEYVFSRSGYDMIKPDEIKTILKQLDKSADGTGSTGTGSSGRGVSSPGRITPPPSKSRGGRRDDFGGIE